LHVDAWQKKSDDWEDLEVGGGIISKLISDKQDKYGGMDWIFLA
jgi:hypothetical protein